MTPSLKSLEEQTSTEEAIESIKRFHQAGFGFEFQYDPKKKIDLDVIRRLLHGGYLPEYSAILLAPREDLEERPETFSQFYQNAFRDETRDLYVHVFKRNGTQVRTDIMPINIGSSIEVCYRTGREPIYCRTTEKRPTFESSRLTEYSLGPERTRIGLTVDDQVYYYHIYSEWKESPHFSKLGRILSLTKPHIDLL
ncbi:hypothetical protein HY496_01295 [Candidatus Woesearchaeota archaeon]|nr:hypothetical protein [Candidatus Woesearchaeota archaeon]